MNHVSDIVSGCAVGVNAKCTYESSYVPISTANKSCATNSETMSSDIFIHGSFCPKRTGMYKIFPNGTVRNAQYTHTFTINSQDYPMNENISLSLTGYRCYPYSLHNADTYSSSASIEYYFNNKKYLLGKEDSLTCIYSGFIQKPARTYKYQRRHNKCQFFLLMILS